MRPLDKDDFGSSDRFARPTFGFLDDGKEALVSVALPFFDGPADGLNPSALAHVLRVEQRQGVDAHGGPTDADQVAGVVQHQQRDDLLLHDARLKEADVDARDLDGAAQLEQGGIFIDDMDLMHRNLSVASDRTMRMPLFAAHVELFDAGT